MLGRLYFQIALLIVLRGYTMSPPSPPYECPHMWGPSLVSSLKDSSLHVSLRQPAFDLIQSIIVSDAAALVFFMLKHHAPPNAGLFFFSDFSEEDDELSFSHDAEEEDSSCWNAFSVQSKLTSRECKGWMCIPMLWFDALTELDPSALPISFSKATFWALSRFSVVEPVICNDMKLPVKDWISSYCPEVLSSLGWQVAAGSDDGGEGKPCKNSVDPSAMCVPLIRMLKRCAAHFVTQMEPFELWKQWTWEPRLAESLILLLLDPNDKARAVTRLILQHVSKGKLLVAGLQFLCSSASSISAIYLGLRYASKLVFLESFQLNFRNLEHWFFILYKLFEEVVVYPKEFSASTGEPTPTKFQLEGGFLRQPAFGQSSVSHPGCSLDMVDTKSWNRLCCMLSGIVWPSALKCLVEGKAFLDKPNFQMACVRLLEVLPAVCKRLIASASELSGDSEISEAHFSNFKWLHDLFEWGKSLDKTISKRWRQCIIFLLKLFDNLCNVDSKSTILAIQKIISSDNVSVDDLEDKISKLSVSLSWESTHTFDQKIFKKWDSSSDGFKLGKKNLATKPSSSGDEAVLDIKELPVKGAEVSTPIVSDTKKSIPVDVQGLSYNRTSQQILDRESRSQDYPEKSTPLRMAKVFSAEVTADVSVSLQKSDLDVHKKKSSSSSISSPGGRLTSIIHSKILDGRQHDTKPKTTSQEKVEISQTVCPGRSDKFYSNTDAGLKSGAAFRKGLIKDTEDETLEVSLERTRHPPSITKPCVSVPRRQVIQLEMPTADRAGSYHRLGSGVKRLRPPRLDDWYRPILEIDYFSIVANSANKDENVAMANFREVPVCFSSPEHYVEIFRPLVLEEFRAQLHSSFLEVSSPAEMSCGSLCVLSVERIDDFHLVRCISDKRDSEVSRGCSENDLVLFTKQPLENTALSVHLVGKVERREKDTKCKSIVTIIRFYLQSASAHICKAKRLLTERSKWYATRIMSITPQLREFQALSSLKDIPMLPLILNPIGQCYPKSRKLELCKLPLPLLQTLKSSFNDSQLQAISIAIGTEGQNKDFDLSLIQGPPGTGKTRTIVAIVSGLLALNLAKSKDISKNACGLSPGSVATGTNQRSKISQSAAIARAWQDAAFARQLMKEEKKDSSVSKEYTAVRGRVLICAQSNAAVDELVARISNEGLYGCDGRMFKPYLVRVGNAKTVHPNSLPFFIDTLVEQLLAEEQMKESNTVMDSDEVSSAALRSKLERLVENIQFYETKRADLRDVGTSKSEDVPKEVNEPEMSDTVIAAKLKVLYGKKKALYVELASAQAREKKTSEERKNLKHKLRKSILREAEIVVTTLSGSGGDVYGVCSESISGSRFGCPVEDSLFDAIIIDEAAQALEPATLIPLQLLKSNGAKCVMVGDPKQLPATVLSSVASKFLYQCSMFERLQGAGHPVTMLNEQYRMHPEICCFPSLHFYDNKLLNGEGMENKSAIFHENMYLRPYAFFDVMDGHEQHGKNSGTLSLYNESEALFAVEMLKYFKKRYPSEFTGGRVGIIAPYRRQVSLLRSCFASAFGSSITVDMEFNTVDGFQGREVDLLILSTVRASDRGAKEHGLCSGSIGFVADVRRMNVALTRARLSLWIVGNAKTLQRNLNWAALLNNAKERNLVISVARPYESMFRKHYPSSIENPRSDNLKKNLAQKPREEAKILEIASQTNNSQVSGQTRISVKDSHEGGGKNVDSKVERGRWRHKSGTRSADEDNECVVPRQDDRSSKDVMSTMEIHNKTACKNKSRLTEQQGGGARSVNKGSASNVSDRLKSERNIEPEVVGSGIEFSKHRKPSSGAVDKRRETDTGKVKDLIGTRKQQRDAVEALLSSALISSKKAETSSKSTSVKRSLSPASSEVIIKPPKTRKVFLTEHPTSSTGQVDEMSAGSDCPQSVRSRSEKSGSSGQSDLEEVWKSFKDVVQGRRGT
ncbi:helicase SEN1 isoform X1 [Aristolochia californica]|uniref:helicase SEN1 isoform X1 n=1 Tax=Aristolochia californica TaxID=171875 RepID=UPI0035E0D122